MFKVAVVILQEHEETLLEMNFEMILSQINVMPIKFIFGEEESELGQWRFDKQMQTVSMSEFLI